MSGWLKRQLRKFTALFLALYLTLVTWRDTREREECEECEYFNEDSQECSIYQIEKTCMYFSERR